MPKESSPSAIVLTVPVPFVFCTHAHAKLSGCACLCVQRVVDVCLHARTRQVVRLCVFMRVLVCRELLGISVIGLG